MSTGRPLCVRLWTWAHRLRVRMSHRTVACSSPWERMWPSCRRGRALHHLPAGRSELRLPNRLHRGEYRLTLSARGSDGRVAIDRLSVLGRHRLEVAIVERALSGYPLDGVALGVVRRQQRSRLQATCRGKLGDACCDLGPVRVRVQLRNDGLLEARGLAGGRVVLGF